MTLRLSPLWLSIIYLPNLLVGIEFRRVRRQKERLELAMGRANEIEYLTRPVRWMPVHDDEDGPRGALAVPE